MDLSWLLTSNSAIVMVLISAVVMETTGDISVLHHEDMDHEIDEVLLEDVRL